MNAVRGVHEFSVVLLIPKTPHDHLKDPKAEGKAIREVVEAVLLDKFGKRPPVWNDPIKDGDTELKQSDGTPKAPGYWFINTRSDEDRPPKLIDGDKQPVKGGWKSGDWGLVKLNPFAYDRNGNKGVSMGLQAVQFLYTDEGFGSAEATDEGFGVVPDAAKPAETEPHDPFADD